MEQVSDLFEKAASTIGPEHAVVREQIDPRPRHEDRQASEEVHWVEHDIRRPIAPRLPQRHAHLGVVGQMDVVNGHGRQMSLEASVQLGTYPKYKAELIRQAYVSFGIGEQDLSFLHLVAALELIGDPTSGKVVQLPGGMSVEKRYHQVIFALPSEEAREEVSEEIAVHLPGLTLLPVRRLEIECREQEASASDIPRLRREANRYDEYVDREAVRTPLVVRGRRPGERFCPLGAPGSKKLADFLADAKVDPKERQRVAVLCDQLGPIWVIGHRIDDRVKLTGLTRRVLHLRARLL